MRLMRLLTLSILTLGLTLAHAAGEPEIQYSATMVASGPEGKVTETRMYMGHHKMRQEMSKPARTIIVDMDRRTSWMLNPKKKEYVEFRAPEGQAQKGPPPGARPPLPDEPGHPCTQDRSELVCKKLGSETMHGRTTDKWEFVYTQEKQTNRSTAWIDRRLRIPIREESDGRWRELRDIQEGPQPDSLFVVPPGYTEKKIQQQR